MRKKYLNPSFNAYVVELEHQILGGSVVVDDEAEVQSMGQEVVDVGFIDNSWE